MASELKTGLLAGLLLAAGIGTAAADTRIDCPLQQARRTITGNFPGGWWTTPIVDRLSQTKVMNIGGKPALMCIYGNAGSVQRNAPAGQSCRAVTGGFICSGGQSAPSVQIEPKLQVPPPNAQQPAKAVTLSTGGLKVRLSQTFDLDRGVVGQSQGADIWLEARTAKDVYLSPRNGAAMSVSGGRNRGRDGCLKGRYSTGKVPLAKLQVGTYICVKTSEKRISEFRINGKPGSVLSLGYTTWK